MVNVPASVFPVLPRHAVFELSLQVHLEFGNSTTEVADSRAFLLIILQSTEEAVTKKFLK